MVSDVLSDTVHAITNYLADPTFNDVYSGERRERLHRLVAQMDAMRQELDEPPRERVTGNNQRR